MRASVAIAVVALCAAVAHGLNMNYPDELTKAYSQLPNHVHVGRFLVQVQVPPEPGNQSRQTIVFFIGAWGNPTSGGRSMTLSGLALTWSAKSHWIASAGTVFCDPTKGTCDFVSAPKADLRVDPANLVMLNITNLQRQGMMGYEVSVPSKKVTTGMITEQVLDESKTVGVYAAAAASNVDNLDKFPYSKTLVLNLAYSASVNPSKDIPLKWEISDRSRWGQKFTQQGDWLEFNWQ